MDERQKDSSLDDAALRRQRGAQSNTAARLGEAVTELMTNCVSPRHAKFEAVRELWSRLLPAELQRHCRLVDVSGGQLKVVADAPPYMHELRLCSYELLRQLQQRCPQARITKIKLAVGRT